MPGSASLHIDCGMEFGSHISRKFLAQMYGKIVFALGIVNLNGFGIRLKHALVANLTTHLGIERSARQHYLIV